MEDPVFVRSRIEYASYTDFWRLVELSGYRTVSAWDVDFAWDGTYIWPVLDAFLMRPSGESAPKRRARFVFWNLERPDAHLPEHGPRDPKEILRAGVTELLQWVDAVWVSDRGLHAMDDRTIYAVLGGHTGLRSRDRLPGDPSIHVLHLGQKTARRREILSRIRERGHRVMSESLWGHDRSFALADSRLLLSIDRVDGLHVAAPLRYALAAAWGLPILSEAVPDLHPLVPGDSILMAGYPDLADAVERALSEPKRLEEIAHKAYHTYGVEWTFRRGVREAIDRTALVERPA